MPKKVSTLLLNILVIILPVISAYCILGFAGFHPLLTNSISFDAKIERINEIRLKKIDLMAIGSSMTLNNISSKVIEDSLPCSYYNFASWGLQMDDIEVLLESYVPRYKPQYVLIASSVNDFTNEGNETIKSYINTPSVLREFRNYFYYQNFNPVTDIIERMRDINKFKKLQNDYQSLDFDPHGGVLLNISSSKISKARWEATIPFPSKQTAYQYGRLSAIARYLKEQHVKLFFVQIPVSRSYKPFRDDRTKLEEHFAKCDSILSANGGIYINLSRMPEYQTDKLFVDNFHLSGPGAILLTKKLVAVIRPLLGARGIK